MTMLKSQPTVLYVDDEPVARRTMCRQLRKGPFRVLTAESGSEALSLAAISQLDAAVLDINMPEMDGFELLQELRLRDPLLPVLMLTGRADTDSLLRALGLGCQGFFKKPLEPMALQLALEKLMFGDELI